MKKAISILMILCCISAADLSAGKKAKHVVVIGVDGMAAKAVREGPAADYPNIHWLMDNGSWTLSKRSVMPSASAINWASTFNGLPTEMHGFSKWNSSRGTIPSTADNGHGIPPTVYTLIREQKPEAETGMICDWMGVGIVADTLAMSSFRFVNTHNKSGITLPPVEYTVKEALPYLAQKKPMLYTIYFDLLDYAGHHFGWYGTEYMDMLKQIDESIALIIQGIKDAGIWNDTVIVLTADHGGKGKGHGKFSIEELETPFVVYGKKIKAGYEFPIHLMQYDTAAIIADILGVKIPADWRGHAVKEIYK